MCAAVHLCSEPDAGLRGVFQALGLLEARLLMGLAEARSRIKCAKIHINQARRGLSIARPLLCKVGPHGGSSLLFGIPSPTLDVLLLQAGAEDMRSSKAAASLALRGPAVQRLFMSMAMPSEEGGIVASWADAERPDAFAECLRALRFPGQDPNVRMSKHGFYIGNPALLQAEAAS